MDDEALDEVRLNQKLMKNDEIYKYNILQKKMMPLGDLILLLECMI